VKTETNLGLFIFPKTILAEKGIISNAKKEGKRAFRVYSPWDLVKNNQAEKSKKWQFEYFYEISKQMEFARIKDIFN
jgi:hypothetical protein